MVLLIVTSQVSCISKQSRSFFLLMALISCFSAKNTFQSLMCMCLACCDNAFDTNYRGEPPSGYFAKEIHICLGVVCISFQVWGFYMATYIFTYSWVIISKQEWRGGHSCFEKVCHRVPEWICCISRNAQEMWYNLLKWKRHVTYCLWSVRGEIHDMCGV